MKQKKLRKRITTWLMCFAMLVTMVPSVSINASAQEDEIESGTEQEEVMIEVSTKSELELALQNLNQYNGKTCIIKIISSSLSQYILTLKPHDLSAGDRCIIDLNGNTLRGFVEEYFMILEEGSFFAIIDSSADGNGSINVQGTYASLVNVNGGTFVLEKANLTNEKRDMMDLVYVKDGSFIMKGGSISYSEKGVLLNEKNSWDRANFVMEGGSIKDTQYGVYIKKGDFCMKGGSITKNSSSINIVNGTVTMENGSITDNYGGLDMAGGITIEGGTVYMKGGSISNNMSGTIGGIYIKDGTFIMEGGSITENAGNQAGGIKIDGGTVVFGGTAKVKDNLNYSKQADNVHLGPSGVLTLGTGTGDDANNVAMPQEGMDIYINNNNENGCFVVGGAFAKDVVYFHSSMSDMYPVYDNGTLKLSDSYGCKVDFDTKGHSVIPQSYSHIAVGSTISKPDDPTCQVAQFDGWYKDEELSDKWNWEVDAIVEDTTLYAKWINHTSYKCVSNGDGTHKALCKDCGATQEGHEADACSGGKATCKAKAICSKCGEEYGSLTAHTDSNNDGKCDICSYNMHTHNGIKVAQVDATCSTYGVKAYYKCSCGKYYADSACTKEITDLAAWKNGEGRIAKKDHSLNIVTTKATTSKDGKLETKCSVCGKVTKTEIIYAVSNINLSKDKYAYTGKVQKPVVTVKDSKGNIIATSNYDIKYPTGMKNVGEYTITIALKGDKYTGTKKISYVINPAKTKLKSVAPKGKSMVVNWTKKAKEVTGYELQYSTSKTFKSGNKKVTIKSAKTTKTTIKKLKTGKKYYVRIRTYKKVGSKKYYSDWSAKKAVTIR